MNEKTHIAARLFSKSSFFFGGWWSSCVYSKYYFSAQLLDLNLRGVQIPYCQPLLFCVWACTHLTSDHNTEYFNNEDQIVCVEDCKISTASTIQKHVQQVLMYCLPSLSPEPQSWYFLCLKYPIIGGISTLRFFLDLVIAKSVDPWIPFNT